VGQGANSLNSGALGGAAILKNGHTVSILLNSARIYGAQTA
jgi:hypothetical protein